MNHNDFEVTDATIWFNQSFKEKELEEKSNVQKMHIANSDRPVAFYSLDVIISIGYRLKSLEGTQFRNWANRILKEYLVKGNSLNESLLREQNDQLTSLKNTVNLLSNVL
ncbi:RhuM family protein [Pedobacter gandavensis]|uniref:RhuM family protein n=1 Tax=Pedobacter gandavensis TaxID=2679963 RepID=UPI00292D6951|nr:RhuM family protein [Pedobacter gandavensis]